MRDRARSTDACTVSADLSQRCCLLSCLVDVVRGVADGFVRMCLFCEAQGQRIRPKWGGGSPSHRLSPPPLRPALGANTVTPAKAKIRKKAKEKRMVIRSRHDSRRCSTRRQNRKRPKAGAKKVPSGPVVRTQKKHHAPLGLIVGGKASSAAVIGLPSLCVHRVRVADRPLYVLRACHCTSVDKAAQMRAATCFIHAFSIARPIRHR